MSRYDSLRASDADRDAVTERLRDAAGEGRLEPDELEQRVDSALRARTYGELAPLVADLPGASNTPWRRPDGSTRALARSALLGAGLLAAVAIAVAVVAIFVVLVVAAAAWWLACVFWLSCCASRRRLASGSHRRHMAPPQTHRPRPSGPI
jgi:Flp pilus assembly protein TadB